MRFVRPTTVNFRFFGLLGLIVLLSSSAFASHVNCAAANTTLSTYAPPADGCLSVNVQFSGFTLTNPTGETIVGSTTVTLPGTSTSVLTGNDIFLANAPSGIGINLDGVDPVGGCDSNSGNAGFCIQGKDQALVQAITYTMTAMSGTIDRVDFRATIFSNSAGTTAIAYRQICPQAVFASNCAGLVTLQAGTVGAQTVAEVTFNLSATFTGQTVLSVRDIVYLQTNNGNGSYSYVDNIGLAINAPEPTTFLTFSFLLSGLGFARFRRKSSNSRHTL